MNAADRLRANLVDQMIADGNLHSGAWIAAFTHVPRHVFLPRFFRQAGDLSGWEAISSDDPGALEMIYTGATWITQLDNDPHRWLAARTAGKPTPGIPTSSSTAPGLMALMLEALDVNDGHQVLEVGTGTGYNTALLCHRLTSTLVTSVEVDPTLAETAQAALHACGYRPRLAVGDGSGGYATGGPYDRLIATCSTATVPPAWIDQVRPGGLILTSLFRDLGGGPLVLLQVDESGQAEGWFLPEYGGFMPVRAHPPAATEQLLDTALASAAADSRPSGLRARLLDSSDFGMIAALRLPGVASIEFTPETGPQRWLLATDGSWACLDEMTDIVSQHGDRRLWDELEDVLRQWTQLGSPPRDRLGLTITTAGEHRYWLDTPQHPWWNHRAVKGHEGVVTKPSGSGGGKHGDKGGGKK